MTLSAFDVRSEDDFDNAFGKMQQSHMEAVLIVAVRWPTPAPDALLICHCKHACHHASLFGKPSKPAD
jgi:hypothetical protein